MFDKQHPIQVLLVDDSRMITRVVSRIIEEDECFQVIGIASDPYEAVDIMKKKRPDVILLDIEMPRMDGLTFLRKIMSQHPIPVVIFSGVAEENSHNAIKALGYGAVAILQKPKSIISPDFQVTKVRFMEALKGAAASKPRLKLLQPFPQKKTSIHSRGTVGKRSQSRTADGKSSGRCGGLINRWNTSHRISNAKFKSRQTRNTYYATYARRVYKSFCRKAELLFAPADQRSRRWRSCQKQLRLYQ